LIDNLFSDSNMYFLLSKYCNNTEN